MNLTAEALIGQHYAFAHGRLGVLRQSLLNQSDVHRLLGAHDMREVEQILIELKLTAVIEQSLRNANDILLALGTWIRAEVEDMVDSSKHDAFRALWMDEDLPLLAYLFKQHAKLTSSISAEPVATIGSYDPSALRSLVDDGHAEHLPPQLVSFVASVRSLEQPTPETIDAAVARFGAAERLRYARMSSSSLIVRYARHTIDVQNVRTALRLLHAHENRPAEFLLDGGTIPTSKLIGSLEKIRIAIDASDLHFHLLKPLNEDIELPTALERGLSDLLATDVERMWDNTLGIEPPFAFAATALSQLRLIRAVILGKKNLLSPQDIKQILPPYIGVSRFAV